MSDSKPPRMAKIIILLLTQVSALAKPCVLTPSNSKGSGLRVAGAHRPDNLVQDPERSKDNAVGIKVRETMPSVHHDQASSFKFHNARWLVRTSHLPACLAITTPSRQAFNHPEPQQLVHSSLEMYGNITARS